MDSQVAYFAIPYIPLLPLVGALFAYVAGLRHRDTAGVLATLACVLSFILTIYTTLNLPDGEVFEVSIFSWISVGDFAVDFALRFDRLTAVMCLVVTGVGSLIHLYSTSYMHEDEGRHRFFAYLNLFMFSMLILVMGANLLVLFVGWEGVGLCSYLLIGFWYKNRAYAAAGMKAFVVNRIGDAGFLVGIFMLALHFKTLDFAELQPLIAGNDGLIPLATIIAGFLFVGAAGKSAQIPLFVWLPDAMAGPTPVSALIHAATMVTAGVYMMARLHFLFALAPLTLAVVCVIALLTAFVAATIALVQNDIKKVLAYSTVSQLGFMFMAASVGAYWVAVFHLVTHAFFKACLFLGAGSVIHSCHHEQDMRRMGGLMSRMPITGITYFISVFAIAGIFPFAGYQSKHAILEALGEAHKNPYLVEFANLIPGIASFIAGITAFYMMRSFVMTFLGEYRGDAHPHESPGSMTIPLILLSILATIGGIALGEMLPIYLFPVLPIEEGLEVEGLPEAVRNFAHHLAGSWIGIVGVVLAVVMYTRLIPRAALLPGKIGELFSTIRAIFVGKYYFDEIYEAIVVGPLRTLSRVFTTRIDKDLIDGSTDGTGAIVEFSGESLRGLHTGQVRHYALFMFSAALVIIFFYLVTF